MRTRRLTKRISAGCFRVCKFYFLGIPVVNFYSFTNETLEHLRLISSFFLQHLFYAQKSLFIWYYKTRQGKTKAYITSSFFVRSAMFSASKSVVYTSFRDFCITNMLKLDPKLISIYKTNIFALLKSFKTNLYSILHTFYDATQIKPEGEEEKSFM